MKNFVKVLAVLLLSAFASGQTTTTYTGVIRDLSQAVVTSGQVTFELRPSYDSTISGFARFTPSTITCSINQASAGTSAAVRATNSVTISGLTGHTFVANDIIAVTGMTDSTFNGTFTIGSTTATSITYPQTAGNATTGSGVIAALRSTPGPGSCTVTMNTALNPSGTSYRVCIQPNFISPGSCFNDYAVAATKDITTVVPTPTTSPAYTFVDLHSAQTIDGNKTFTGSTSFTGSLSLGALSLSSLSVSGLSTLNGGTLNGTYGGNPTLSGNVSVGGTLGVTGASTFGVALASMLENICYADQQTGADIGAKVNACLTKIAAQTPPVGCVEIPEGTWTWSTPTVYSAKNNFCLLGRGFFNTKVINGVTGAPANNMISLVNVNGAYVAGINISGNGATNVGHAISVISNDGTVHAAYHFLDMRCGDFDGNTGKDHAGATVAASCFYLWNVNGVSFDNVITFGNNIAGVSHGLFIDNDPTGGISPVNVIVAKNFKANSWGGDGIFERLGASTPFNCYGCDAEFNFGWGINATGFSGGGWHGGYMEHNNSGGINITSVSDGFSVDTSFFSNTFGNVPAIQFASVTHSKNVSIRDNSFAASAAVTYTCLVCVDIQDSVISNLNVDAFTGSTVTDFVKLTTGSARNSIDRLSPGQTALNGGTVTNLLNDTVNSQVLSSALAGAFPYLQSGITIVGSGQLARVLQIGTASTNGLNICGSDFSTNGDCVIIWQSVNGVPNTANIQVANNTNFSTTLNLQPSGGTVNIGTLKATVTVGSNTVTTAGTAVTNGTCQAQTGITITGSLTTDEAVANINAALPATWQTGIRWSAEVSAAGTCTVNLCNPTAGSITPAATAVRCTVTR